MGYKRPAIHTCSKLEREKMNTQEENIKRFESLMGKINRTGKDHLLDYLRTKTDFFTAPASTQFHLSCEGGLLQHSLNVYDCLMAKKESPIWGKILKEIPEESLIIVSLLHDLCKINFYVKGVKNQKTYDKEKVNAAEPWQVKKDSMGEFIWETVMRYEVKDTIPLGHGEKSVIIINQMMPLRIEEVHAIRWHMGYTEEKIQYRTLDEAMERFPLVLALHEADLEATKLLEDTNGNKV